MAQMHRSSIYFGLGIYRVKPQRDVNTVSCSLGRHMCAKALRAVFWCATDSTHNTTLPWLTSVSSTRSCLAGHPCPEMCFFWRATCAPRGASLAAHPCPRPAPVRLVQPPRGRTPKSKMSHMADSCCQINLTLQLLAATWSP